jgi:hypothetical protein
MTRSLARTLIFGDRVSSSDLIMHIACMLRGHGAGPGNEPTER